LHEFVSTYNAEFSQWNSEFTYGAHRKSDVQSRRRRMAVPPLDGDVTANVYSHLQQFVHDFSRRVGKQQLIASEELSSLDALYLLNILSRSSANVLVLMADGSPLLMLLIKVLRVAALRITKLPDVSQLPSSSLDVYLQALLAHCLQILLNFLGGPSWIDSYEPTEVADTLTSTSTSSSSNHSSGTTSPGKRILQGGALLVLKGVCVCVCISSFCCRCSNFSSLLLALSSRSLFSLSLSVRSSLLSSFFSCFFSSYFQNFFHTGIARVLLRRMVMCVVALSLSLSMCVCVCVCAFHYIS
jgi:hypothetical protein